jgi:membrane protein implicated in regulation of membrane protease activity
MGGAKGSAQRPRSGAGQRRKRAITVVGAAAGITVALLAPNTLTVVAIAVLWAITYVIVRRMLRPQNGRPNSGEGEP